MNYLQCYGFKRLDEIVLFTKIYSYKFHNTVFFFFTFIDLTLVDRHFFLIIIVLSNINFLHNKYRLSLIFTFSKAVGAFKMIHIMERG